MYEELVENEKGKFAELYQAWKDAVVRFHWLKQEDAIEKFLVKMNSKHFVNPETKIELYSKLKTT